MREEQATAAAELAEAGTTMATLSVINAHHPKRLAKHYRLEGGELVKEPGGKLVRGFYERRELAGPYELADLLIELEPHQALTFGVALVASAAIASAKAASTGDLVRNRAHFDWPAGAGWLLIDYDPADGKAPLSREGLWWALCVAWPELAEAPAVVGDSGSSYLYAVETGEQLKGEGGKRVYVKVADARDVPRAGQVLHERLWLAGHGYYAISKAGAALDRSLIDANVWQPERLDFAAGAACGKGVEQQRPDPEPVNPDAEPVDTVATLPDLTTTERERLRDLRSEARQLVKGKREDAREAWIAERLSEIGDGASEDARERLREAVRDGRLYGDFALYHGASGQWVTVSELLDSPRCWHGERFADPLEPDYRGDTRVAWANLRSGGKPYLYSHAHGGARFQLVRPSATICTVAGEMPRMIRESEELMAHAGEVFQRGGELVRVLNDGRTHAVTGPWLRTHLETVGRWLRYDKRAKEWLPTDAPSDLASRILHNHGMWQMSELTSVVRGPILRVDGSLLETPGYDPDTGLLLMATHPDAWPPIPDEPTPEQVRAAVATLWDPFSEFPFVGALSRSVHLAALLTAVQRPVLETAPAFGLSAYKAGTGKTKAAKAIAWLGGEEPVESPWSTEAEEQRKKLMSALMEGPAAILFDNVAGPMESEALCAALTSSRYKDRRLGASEEISAPTRCLVTITGNNLRLQGDLSRRVLVSTIDHGVEAPERLAFGFDPVQRVRERWLHYRAAALTILRGFLAVGAPAKGVGVVGSYENWDRLIRQAVVWLRDEGLAPFELADPADAVVANYDADPDTNKLHALMVAWEERFGDRPTKVGDLLKEIGGSDMGAPSPSREALLEALQEIAGEPEKINRRRLGRWIEARAGRVLDGRRIVEAGKHGGSKAYRLERVT